MPDSRRIIRILADYKGHERVENFRGEPAALIIRNVAPHLSSYAGLFTTTCRPPPCSRFRLMDPWHGLSRSELDAIIPTLERRAPESPPGPLTDTSARLVLIRRILSFAPKATDIRGPCPGLNTLASSRSTSFMSLCGDMHRYSIQFHLIVPSSERHCHPCTDRQRRSRR